MSISHCWCWCVWANMVVQFCQKWHITYHYKISMREAQEDIRIKETWNTGNVSLSMTEREEGSPRLLQKIPEVIPPLFWPPFSKVSTYVSHCDNVHYAVHSCSDWSKRDGRHMCIQGCLCGEGEKSWLSMTMQHTWYWDICCGSHFYFSFPAGI